MDKNFKVGQLVEFVKGTIVAGSDISGETGKVIEVGQPGVPDIVKVQLFDSIRIWTRPEGIIYYLRSGKKNRHEYKDRFDNLIID